VVLFPVNVGPPTLTGTGLDASEKVLTEVGATRVLFDGVASPMIYATRNQVAAWFLLRSPGGPRLRSKWSMTASLPLP